MSDEFAKDFIVLQKMVFDPDSEDRVVAIISAAYLEKYLVGVIEGYFPAFEDDPALKKAMFNDVSGMAGTLGNKLDMGRALNAITPQTYEDGKLIARVRNKFAHHLEVTSFDHPKVRDLVDQLKTGKNTDLAKELAQSREPDRAWDFRVAAIGVCSMILHQHIKEYPFRYSSPDGLGAIGTGERPASLDKLSKPPRREK